MNYSKVFHLQINRSEYSEITNLFISTLLILLLIVWPLLLWLLLSMRRKPVVVILGQSAVEEFQARLMTENIVLNLGVREFPFSLSSVDRESEKEALRSKHRKLFIKSRDESLRLLDVSRLCYHCFAIRPYRTYHCHTCKQCIPCLDHHCVWVGGCIGAKEHRIFVLFLLSSCLLQDIHLLLLIYFLLSGHITSFPFFSVAVRTKNQCS